jgi:hypothetical protein
MQRKEAEETRTRKKQAFLRCVHLFGMRSRKLACGSHFAHFGPVAVIIILHLEFLMLDLKRAPALCVLMCLRREMERREKVEEARRETERILAEQEAEVACRKVCAGGATWLPGSLASHAARTCVSTAYVSCLRPLMQQRLCCFESQRAGVVVVRSGLRSSSPALLLLLLQKAMEERDAERIKRMAVEAAERAAANAVKKKKAEERIAGRAPGLGDLRYLST